MGTSRADRAFSFGRGWPGLFSIITHISGPVRADNFTGRALGVVCSSDKRALDDTSLSLSLKSKMITFNPKLDRLMLAMQSFEGWTPGIEGLNQEASASFRNHNPLNLTESSFESGKASGKSVFINDAVGWMAAHYDIMLKAKGQTSTGLNGNSTIGELIAVWARTSPPEVIKNYTNSVVRDSGLPETTKLRELIP